MKKDNTRYVRALERKVIQLSRILLRTRKDADVSAIEYSELHQEIQQANDQIRRENDRFRQENERLLFENEQLRRINGELSFDLQELESEHTVLLKRPALHDPLVDPIRRLPQELQDMVQAEALHLDHPVKLSDIQPFLESQRPPAAGIDLPFELRPRYLKAFLHSNTVDVDSLWYSRHASREYGLATGHTVTMKDSIRSLHLNVVSSDLFSSFRMEKKALSIMKRCTKTEHLELSFTVRPVDYMFWHSRPSEPEEDQYFNAITALPKLKTINITTDADQHDWGMRGLLDPTRAWFDVILARWKKAIMQSCPVCKITEDLGVLTMVRPAAMATS